jgi:hypothetical protein
MPPALGSAGAFLFLFLLHLLFLLLFLFLGRLPNSGPTGNSADLQPFPDLGGVMLSVDKVEFAPLVRGERAEKRMIHELCSRAKASLAVGKARFHLLDLREYHGTHPCGRYALRDSPFGSFPALRHEADIDYQQRSQTVFQSSGRGQSRALFQTHPKTVIRVLVCQEEMLENLAAFHLPAGA